MERAYLIKYLDAIPDKRRGAGQRHDHTFMLLLVIMATMSGYIGYRAIGDFIERNHLDLLKLFQPKKNRLPSFYTIRRVLQNLDFVLLSKQFHKWAVQYIDVKQGEWISIDGKSIKGTMQDYEKSHQHFINLVSLYCSKQKLILGKARVENSKESEIPVVQQLISALDIEDVIFTLDALHCQKKPHKP